MVTVAAGGVTVTVFSGAGDRTGGVLTAARSRCRVPNEVPTAPPTAWVEARRFDPRGPVA